MSPFIPILTAGAAAAAVSDLRTRRIPNVHSAALAVAGLACAAVERGLGGIAVAAAMIACVLLVGTIAFSRGWFGGGDVKLIAAGCSGLAPAHAVDFLLYTALCGGLLALAALAASPQRMAAAFLTRTLPQTGTRLPYAVAIAGGALVLWVALLWPAYLLVP